MAGLLALSSTLGATPEATPREPALYRIGSNAVQVLAPVAPFLPPPFNALVEGILALGGALLAFWASHIHRTVAEIKNGAPKPPAAGQPPPPRPKGAGTLDRHGYVVVIRIGAQPLGCRNTGMDGSNQ